MAWTAVIERVSTQTRDGALQIDAALIESVSGRKELRQIRVLNATRDRVVAALRVEVERIEKSVTVAEALPLNEVLDLSPPQPPEPSALERYNAACARFFEVKQLADHGLGPSAADVETLRQAALARYPRG